MTPRFAGRLVIAVSPSDIGRRVTIRRADPDGFRDTIGVLTSWHEGVLGVRRRDGTLVDIPESAVVAARVIPER
ncbi:putative acetyltransferase [Sphaerisporangium aureirubrum]|uniref:Histone acetyltransferase Rv0428c-like SH3 domain-containing protein n=1 Tax=Sphaerisporangium aureirubrum TaxID=1544736 RepID=A0ABW1NFB5_9ACTN